MHALLLTAEPGRFVWVVTYTNIYFVAIIPALVNSKTARYAFTVFERNENVLCNDTDW
jgi:hypothetical protein